MLHPTQPNYNHAGREIENNSKEDEIGIDYLPKSLEDSPLKDGLTISREYRDRSTAAQTNRFASDFHL